MDKLNELKQLFDVKSKEFREFANKLSVDGKISEDERSKADSLKADLSGIKSKMELLEMAQDSTFIPDVRARLDNKGNALESKEYRTAFNHYFRTTDDREIRAMSIGTGADGGYLTHEEWNKEIIKGLADVNPFRQLAGFINTKSKVNIPIKTANGTAVLIGENADATGGITKPTLDNKVLGGYKLMYISTASDELVRDSDYDLEGFLKDDFTDATNTKELFYFSQGSGSSQPEGVSKGASVGLTTASSTAITADELKSFSYSLKAKYKPNAVIMMNSNTALAIDKLRYSSNDPYIWNNAFSGPQSTLFGKPVVLVDDMPEMVAGAIPIVFGDMKYFKAVMRGPVAWQVLTERYAEIGQVGYKGWYRIDSVVSLSEAIVGLKMKP